MIRGSNAASRQILLRSLENWKLRVFLFQNVPGKSLTLEEALGIE
jgi:hypothetical protein